MIEIKNLEFAYTKNKKLFENLTMKFNPGSIYGLLGKNGSGKTTLMKLISGLRYPQAGSIFLNCTFDGISSPFVGSSINKTAVLQASPNANKNFFFCPKDSLVIIE